MTIQRLLGLGRLIFGVGFVALPAVAGKAMIGRGGDRPGAQAVVRGFGARDAALGIGILLAAGAGTEARRWLALAAVCDLADLAANGVNADDMDAADMAFGLGLPAAAAVAYGTAALTAEG